MSPSDRAAPPLVTVERCPGCHSDRREPQLRDYGGIAVVRCRDCDLVYASACYAPRFLDEHYADRARRAPSSDPAARTPRPGSERKRHAVALYDRLCGGRLVPAPPHAKALDIGCGTGLLLDLLREAGYETVGVERSAAAAQAIAAGHRVHALDIEGRVALDERFSLITLTHVLEHLRQPEAALGWVRSHLRPDGFAVIEVPNWDDLARPLWGSRYRPLELGDHVTFFQRDTLADLLGRSGLRLHAMWSAAQARTLVFPSLLTGLDLALGPLRRLRRAGSASAARGVGVASARTGAGRARWRQLAVTAALHGLDRLDPLLESLTGTGWQNGANLVAVLQPGPLPS